MTRFVDEMRDLIDEEGRIRRRCGGDNYEYCISVCNSYFALADIFSRHQCGSVTFEVTRSQLKGVKTQRDDLISQRQSKERTQGQYGAGMFANARRGDQRIALARETGRLDGRLEAHDKRVAMWASNIKAAFNVIDKTLPRTFSEGRREGQETFAKIMEEALGEVGIEFTAMIKSSSGPLMIDSRRGDSGGDVVSYSGGEGTVAPYQDAGAGDWVSLAGGGSYRRPEVRTGTLPDGRRGVGALTETQSSFGEREQIFFGFKFS